MWSSPDSADVQLNNKQANKQIKASKKLRLSSQCLYFECVLGKTKEAKIQIQLTNVYGDGTVVYIAYMFFMLHIRCNETAKSE